jgi:hypothetical protein
MPFSTVAGPHVCRSVGPRRLRGVGRLTYTVRVGSLNGVVIGHYQQPGPEEPRVGALLQPSADLPDGPWRVSDYVQTDDSAPANNVLIVERIAD